MARLEGAEAAHSASLAEVVVVAALAAALEPCVRFLLRSDYLRRFLILLFWGGGGGSCAALDFSRGSIGRSIVAGALSRPIDRSK